MVGLASPPLEAGAWLAAGRRPLGRCLPPREPLRVCPRRRQPSKGRRSSTSWRNHQPRESHHVRHHWLALLAGGALEEWPRGLGLRADDTSHVSVDWLRDLGPEGRAGHDPLGALELGHAKDNHGPGMDSRNHIMVGAARAEVLPFSRHSFAFVFCITRWSCAFQCLTMPCDYCPFCSSGATASGCTASSAASTTRRARSATST